ncbi:unnamed protein product [Gordionus sp. m RMFG-2023]
MAGGYLEDSYCQGIYTSYQGYRFNYWPYIDGFIYFSHHFITIPPTGWIHSAHINGVPIYGTFITESSDGQATCQFFLSSTDLAKSVADKMISLAIYYNFDGWLLNIENEIEVSQIQTLLYFIRYLKNGIHAALPHSKIIWYDSVTTRGKLVWQNELNEKNMPFFLASDGIFLNYTWTECTLEKTLSQYRKYNGSLINKNRNLLTITNESNKISAINFVKNTESDHALSNMNNIHLLKDIFVGIDVFGRGMIGGGGFNTHIAVDLARKHKMSIALFAIAWTYQKFDYAERRNCEKLFWESLKSYLYPENIPFFQLPLLTMFCDKFLLKNFETNTEPIKIECPLGYLLNLHCQTTLPLLISTDHSQYDILLTSQGVMIELINKKPSHAIDNKNDENDNIKEYVKIPLYVTNFSLPNLKDSHNCVLISLNINILYGGDNLKKFGMENLKLGFEICKDSEIEKSYKDDICKEWFGTFIETCLEHDYLSENAKLCQKSCEESQDGSINNFKFVTLRSEIRHPSFTEKTESIYKTLDKYDANLLSTCIIYQSTPDPQNTNYKIKQIYLKIKSRVSPTQFMLKMFAMNDCKLKNVENLEITNCYNLCNIMGNNRYKVDFKLDLSKTRINFITDDILPNISVIIKPLKFINLDLHAFWNLSYNKIASHYYYNISQKSRNKLVSMSDLKLDSINDDYIPRENLLERRIFNSCGFAIFSFVIKRRNHLDYLSDRIVKNIYDQIFKHRQNSQNISNRDNNNNKLDLKFEGIFNSPSFYLNKSIPNQDDILGLKLYLSPLSPVFYGCKNLIDLNECSVITIAF